MLAGIMQSPVLAGNGARPVLQELQAGLSEGQQTGVQGGGQASSALWDQFELSPEAGQAFRMARGQFEVNVQTLRAVTGPEGSMYEEFSFSFRASFEVLQEASGEQPVDFEALDSEDLLARLKDLFSPEKTAQRILDFALSHYAPAGEDGEAARQAFADRIGSAIQEGFDQAQTILGELEESIQAGIDQTHARVFDGLDRFVTEGLPEDHAERSSRIQAYAAEWQVSAHLEVVRLEGATYNARGEVAPPAETGVQNGGLLQVAV